MELREVLTRLGAIPDSPVTTSSDSNSIIQSLFEFWLSQADSRRGAAVKKAARLSEWLECQLAAGAVAEFFSSATQNATQNATPNATPNAATHNSLTDAFGKRILWWPQGRPAGRQVAIVSSRIGRKLQERPQWFETLRLATGTLDSGDFLVTARRTTTHRFVSRLAEMLTLPRIEMRFASPRLLTEKWFEWLIKETTEPSDQSVSLVYVSPPLDELSGAGPSRRQNDASQTPTFPEQDLAVSLLADQMWVLSLREGGNLETLLKTGLTESTFAPGAVRLLPGEGLVEESQAQSLQDRGAVAWYLTSTERAQIPEPLPTQDSPRMLASDFCQFVEEAPWTWLTHCTRQPGETWPGEPQTDFVDEVLLSESSDRSPLAALLRILSQETLIASGVGIRGESPVVCFSASPLTKLLKNRTWQRHRTRWDFEPFGICIRQAVLNKLGARPVQYGDDETWATLGKPDRPWFQKQASQVGSGTVDWSSEQEWRVRGDLDLSRIEADEAFVFVPTEAAASEVRAVSRWPVVVVGGLPVERKRNRGGASSRGA
jgi:hypothetical protein